MSITDLGSIAATYVLGEKNAYASCLRLFAPNWEAVAKIRADARVAGITGLPSKRELRKGIRAARMREPKENRRCRQCSLAVTPAGFARCRRDIFINSPGGRDAECSFWSPVIPD